MKKQRVLPIESGLNFRELGGYPTRNGKTIKWQKLLRSGYLSVLKSSLSFELWAAVCGRFAIRL